MTQCEKQYDCNLWYSTLSLSRTSRFWNKNWVEFPMYINTHEYLPFAASETSLLQPSFFSSAQELADFAEAALGKDHVLVYIYGCFQK